MKNTVVLAAAVMILALGTSFASTTATSNMAVSATVESDCTISAGALAFGTYDPIITNKVSNLNGQATVSVVCTNGSSVAITLGQGLNAASGSTDLAPARRLTDGTNFLTYSLYSDPTRLVVWGNDSSNGVGFNGTGLNQDTTVFGAIDGNQNMPAGPYADTVVATVTF